MPFDSLTTQELAHQAVRIEQAREQNRQWLRDEAERLRLQAEDILRAAEARIEALGATITAARKRFDADFSMMSPEERVAERARIAELETQVRTIQFERLNREGRVSDQVRGALDKADLGLAIAPVLVNLFMLRWRVSE